MHLPSVFLRIPLLRAAPAALGLCTAAAAAAQGTAFQSPGMPSSFGQNPDNKIELGQVTRFSSEFNPAISFVLDASASYSDVGGPDDGFELDLRSGELGINSHIDPRAWAYAIVVFENEDAALEEGAIHFTGLGHNSTIKAGRFFVDFGKTMQWHTHELRTLERPAVLREYLGSELGGNGAEWDQWFTAGESTVVRFSLGVFQSLLPEAANADEFAPLSFEKDRKQLDELAFTARVTGFTDIGDSSTLQLGASLRALPDFGFELPSSGASADGLSNNVFGLDLTYAWADSTNTRKLTLGGEYLLSSGDNGAQAADAGTPLDPSDDTLALHKRDVSGFYVFADYAWNREQSAGLQYSWLELPQSGEPSLGEVDAYFTQNLSEFQRLRFGLRAIGLEDQDDQYVAYLQYDGILGAHGHGINF